MERELRPIPGFPGYLAGDDGTVWTLKAKGGNDRRPHLRSEPVELSSSKDRRGYLRVSLDVQGRVVTGLVHRLVLLAFRGVPPDGYCGCHYPDPNKENNHLSNLRWDTVAENARDQYRDRISDGFKSCSKCGLRLPVQDFYSDKRASDGLHTQCRTCHKQLAKETRDPEKRRASGRDAARRRRARLKAAK